MEQDIFQTIYAQYYPVVYRLGLGYFKGDSGLADDMVQEVFIRVWKKYDYFKGESQVNTWVYRIAINCCLTEIRRKKSYETRVLLYQEPETDSAEKQQNDQKILHHCIAQLNEPDRVLTMLILEDLSHQDIARILGITEVNARVKVHRVKEKLHRIYQDMEIENH